MHELGYVVVALGQGRFTFHRPDSVALPDASDRSVDPSVELTGVPVKATTIAPSWGGERLDLDHLIGGLAANLLARAGHRLADVPYPDLDPALRRAAQWPGALAPPPWSADRAA